MKFILGPENRQKELNFSLLPFRNKGLTVPGILGGYKNLGILFSGGLDSTIVTCLILRELHNLGMLDSINVTCFTVCKTSGSTYYADRMITQLEHTFGKKLGHISNIDNPGIQKTPTPLYMFTILDIKKAYKDFLFFTGNISYPDKNEKDFVCKDCMTNLPDDKLHDARIPQPIVHLYKYHAIDLYYKLGVEHLIPYTHSCTRQSIGTCGECTACEERIWAFSVLGINDPTPVMPDLVDLSNNGDWKFTRERFSN